jgi:hypothetical protein
MIIDSSGNVGIGTMSSPGAGLDIAYSGAAAALRVYNSQATNPYGLLVDNTGGDTADANYIADFRVGGNSKLTVLNSGNVGIGASSPGSNLVVRSATPSVSFETTGFTHGFADTIYSRANGAGAMAYYGSTVGGIIDVGITNSVSTPGLTLMGINNAQAGTAVTQGAITFFAGKRGTTSTIALEAGDAAFDFNLMSTGWNPGTNLMRITGAGNLKIAGTATRATTEGTNHLDIFDGTAPVGTLANGISLYSTSGELRVMDAAGNATLLSPHDKPSNYWIYDSVNTTLGKNLKIDMEEMMKALNYELGWDFVHECLDDGHGGCLPGTNPDQSITDKFTASIQKTIGTLGLVIDKGVATVEELFTKKIHSETICLKKSDGTEACLNGDQLQTIINNGSLAPAPTPVPPPQIPPTDPVVPTCTDPQILDTSSNTCVDPTAPASSDTPSSDVNNPVVTP